MTHLVILRPDPGASATIARARAAGWETASRPLFAIVSLDWTPPASERFDSVLMTSANAARHGGPGLAYFAGLPLYAVGTATAREAREAGFARVIAGGKDAAAIADWLRADGREHVVHFSGAHIRPFDESGFSLSRIPVYAAEPVEPEGLAAALTGEPIVLLHSPRAARRFGLWCDAHGLDRTEIALVAISANALGEAGGGWRKSVAAAEPDDAAMIEAARTLIG